MSKKTELEYAINALFACGTSKQADIQEAKDRLDYTKIPLPRCEAEKGRGVRGL